MPLRGLCLAGAYLFRKIYHTQGIKQRKISREPVTTSDFLYQVDFRIGDLEDDIRSTVLFELLQVMDDLIELVFFVSPGYGIGGLRVRVFRGCGKDFTGIALAGNLEIGNFGKV
jgi:hypothetical protein